MIVASAVNSTAAKRAKMKPVSLSPVGREIGKTRPGGDPAAGGQNSTNSGKAAEPSSTDATLIVLGRDASGKAHASWFGEGDAALAAKAAQMMGMAALRVATDELRALAGKLPHGRVFASGRAFVPFVRASLFDELVKYAPEASKAATPKASAGSNPASGSGNATAEKEAGAPTKEGKPTDWSGIDAGHLVLASDAVDDGWWEATVENKNAMGLLTLKWRDWPELGQFVRRSEDVALLHPAFDARKPRS